MRIVLTDSVDLQQLFREYEVNDYKFVSADIGYDGNVYCLFSACVPSRINGMFVNTSANTEYAALVITPSWYMGNVLHCEKLNFGKHAMNYHFLKPVPDGSFLLLGSRCMYSEKKGPEHNAVFVDREGTVLRSLTFGDGIADCIVRNDGMIITSFFDEGVFGNYGWKNPIGSCGICARNINGEIIWKPNRDIYDCYAIVIDTKNNIWYYYYDEFDLIKTDFKTETVYHPDREGSSILMLADNNRALIMDGGYDDPSLCLCRFQKDGLSAWETIEFLYRDEIVEARIMDAYGSCALIQTNHGVFFVDFDTLLLS